MKAQFYVTITTTVDPSTKARKLATVAASQTMPSMAVSPAAKVLRVILDIPDLELEVPTLRAAWPGQVTQEIVAEVSDWANSKPN